MNGIIPTLDSDVLSKRAQYTYSCEDFLVSFLKKCEENAFHPIENPQGIINLGTAVNRLMEKELRDQISSNDAFNYDPERHQHYFDFPGTSDFRTAVASFFNRYMNSFEDISPENIIVMNGTAACLDSLAFTLFDPNDIFLTPTPTYARIYTDLNDRSLATPYPLELPEEPDCNGKSFCLSSDLLEKRIVQLKDEGKIVKGFVLINPQNPLGDIYTPELLRSILQVCAKYKIHVIIDEIYAFSSFGEGSNFNSVMSLSKFPDPQRTHVVWALTKDFCLAGFRVGVIYSRNSAVLKVLGDLSIYSSPASIIQDVGTVLLSDSTWLDNVYFPRNKERLQEKYQICVQRLEKIGATVRQSEAGLFAWFCLKKFLKSNTEEGEMELFKELFEAGVYMVPGCQFYCKSPGWFRITFAVSLINLTRGLEILEDVLRKRKNGYC